jgi:hypothetical protein
MTKLLRPGLNLKRRNREGSTLAEFGPALFLFFIAVFFPAINLLGFALGVATAELIADRCAIAAADEQTYGEALDAACHTAVQLNNSPLGKFAGLKPVNGYNGSGVDLYIATTNLSSRKTTVCGPDIPLKDKLDTTGNVYEYEAQVNYAIGPLLSMSQLPFVKDIPIIGKPASFSYTVEKAAEHLDGLSAGAVPVQQADIQNY